MITESIKLTNKLLLIFAAVLALYILKVLSFIFVPLAFACFLSILFLPFTRWANKRNMPKYVSIVLSLTIMAIVLFAAFEIIKLSGKEILEGRAEMYQRLDEKFGNAAEPVAQLLNIDFSREDGIINGILHNSDISKALVNQVGSWLGTIKDFSMTLCTTILFLILILAGSVNFKLVMQETLIKRPQQISEVFWRIEKSISKFVCVKIATSFLTGLLFGITAWAFGISFPILWGILAFSLNFIQVLGSIIVTVAVSVMAIIDITHPGAMLATIILFIAIQVVVGSVLEPILMGKSFKINIVAVLIMLMFWGFLWGIAGMVLAIPMAVLTKILCEQFPQTQGIARIMS